MANTTKRIATAFTLTSRVALFITIFDIAADAEGAFAKKAFLKPHISPIITAMRYGKDAVDVFMNALFIIFRFLASLRAGRGNRLDNIGGLSCAIIG